MTQDIIDKARHAASQREKTEPYDLLLHRMGGDASDRSYYRVHYGAFGKRRSAVLMVLADSGPFIQSEEVTLYHDESGELPFLNIHRFLEGIGAPVPRVLFCDLSQGIILLEDLGDTLLSDAAGDPDRDKVKKLYRRAIDQLVYLQIEGSRRLTDDCLAGKQTYSADMFRWEFNHFVEYGIEARGGVIPASVKEELTRIIWKWSEHLALLPQVFTHRDYHSRNLMAAGERLVMIDFQDALLGPSTYDLASLLRDSYVDLGWETVEELVAYYLETWRRRGGEPLEEEHFRRDLWATALQRNLKAAGRFVFIEQVKGKPGYLKDIPRTLSYLPGYVRRAPALGELVERLLPYTPETS